MQKHLLFLPFMALLATSCGGGHITTTPVVKNAPSAVLDAPSKKNLQAQGQAGDIACVKMSEIPWSKTNQKRFFSPYLNGKAIYATSDNTNADILCSTFQTKTAGQVYANTYEYSIALNDAGAIYVFVSSDFYENNTLDDFYSLIADDYLYYRMSTSGQTADETIYQSGYANGYEEGYNNGYDEGFEDGGAGGQRLLRNGQYTGLTIFSRRTYLKKLGMRVVSGLEQLQAGYLDLIDTNANYTIHIKWSYSYPKTTFQDYGNTIIGELYWTDIISNNWSTSWFGYYDAELHYFTSQRNYANLGVLETSFYPEVYIASTMSGDPNLYFFGSGNAYQLGFADGQTYTIQASETYNNVFTIFTPAFRAVANFFNLNIGPFKIWYFFAIPLIVSLLILVLRLVKH